MKEVWPASKCADVSKILCAQRLNPELTQRLICVVYRTHTQTDTQTHRHAHKINQSVDNYTTLNNLLPSTLPALIYLCPLNLIICRFINRIKRKNK